MDKLAPSEARRSPSATPPEEWLPLISYRGNYFASNYGRFYSNALNSIIEPKTGRDGRLVISIYVEGARGARATPSRWTKMTFNVHELIANIFVQKPKDFEEGKYEIVHIDGDRTNNYFMNLQWWSVVEHRVRASSTLKS